MYINIEDSLKQTPASLLRGILGDLHDLGEQQIRLTRREIEDELGQRVAAAKIPALGVSICFLGAIELCLALTHLMHAMASPPGIDLAWLPMWACHGVLAVVLLVIGSVVTWGLGRFSSNLSPPNQSTVNLHKDIPWAIPQR